jgi:hypothetical protein
MLVGLQTVILIQAKVVLHGLILATQSMQAALQIPCLCGVPSLARVPGHDRACEPGRFGVMPAKTGEQVVA